MSKPPIFIVGCPRSGTSLLRNRLSRHKNMHFPSESHFIPQMYLAYGHPTSDAHAWEMAERILKTFWVDNWGIQLTKSDFTGVRTYRKLVEIIFQAWADKSGSKRLCDKTPHNVLFLPTMVEIFPDAKFILLLRDGRDVALSWLFSRYEPRNLYTAARMWKHFTEKGLAGSQQIAPENFLQIKYEDLVEDPESTFTSIFSFLEEDPSLVREGKVIIPKKVTLAHKGMALNTNKPILKNNTMKWKAQMKPSDQLLFESVAGDTLGKLGYELAGQTRRVGVLEKAFWNVHHTVKYYATRIVRPHMLQRTRTYIIAFIARRRF